MKISKTRLKEIIKEELENVLEGVAIPWCVGYVKKDKEGKIIKDSKGNEIIHYERVYADAGGVAETKLRGDRNLPADAIRSTHNMNEKKDTKCKKQ
jgi:hypothetical protein